MPRPREFDMDEALDAAIGMFWTKGYKATSMADLMEATGLHKGSIYKAFDDKHDLFVKSLTRYLQESYRQTHAALSNADTPRDGLRAWLHIFCSHVLRPTGATGLPGDEYSRRTGPARSRDSPLLQRHHASTSGLLIDTIERGQQSGQIRCDLTPDNLAKALFRSVPAFLAPPKSCATRSTPTRW